MQFIYELDSWLAARGLEVADERQIWRALVLMEQKHGPQLGCSGIANGAYEHNALYASGDQNGASTYDTMLVTKYFIRLDWPPVEMGGGAPAAMQMAQQQNMRR